MSAIPASTTMLQSKSVLLLILYAKKLPTITCAPIATQDIFSIPSKEPVKSSNLKMYRPRPLLSTLTVEVVEAKVADLVVVDLVVEALAVEVQVATEFNSLET